MPFKPSGASLVDVARETQDTGFGPGQVAAGGVTSVAGRTGVVTLTEADIASLVADLAAKLVKASNLSDLVDAAAARGNLGLGTAATHATGDFDAAGAAAAAQAAAIAAALTQPGQLLGITAYGPGSVASYTTASTGFVDVDAANLILPVTIPASGKVIVVLSALVRCVHSTAGTFMDWAVRIGTGATLSPAVVAQEPGVVGSSFEGRVTRPIYLTGLTPGATIFRWQFAEEVAGGHADMFMDDGTGHAGPALMEAYAA